MFLISTISLCLVLIFCSYDAPYLFKLKWCVVDTYLTGQPDPVHFLPEDQLQPPVKKPAINQMITKLYAILNRLLRTSRGKSG